jgi:hypothetical protein
MDVVNVIISLVSGINGGNVAGTAMEGKNLGVLGNTISGLVGGGVGGYILKLLGLFATAATAATAGQAEPAQAFDLTTILGNIGGSGVGGAILTMIVAWIKNASQQK